MTTETKVDEFRVDDVVWCVLHGKGIVTIIHNWEEADECPVRVDYCNVDDYNYYTLDGKFSKEGPRALFFSEPKIEASVVRPFVPTLVGKRVVVVPKFDREVSRLVTVFKEDSERIYVTEEGHYWDKNKIDELYEVQSENLLKP